MTNSREQARKQPYMFNGAVKVYDRLAEESFKAETYATSVGKARCNIAYQFRKKANIASHVPVTLVGDIIAMR